MSDTPSPFSQEVPNLQLVWDATSYSALLFCPRYYQYNIIEGYRGTGVDVEFGGFFASAVETYKKARALGATKQRATLGALRRGLNDTWPAEGGPWGGSYQELWRCTGTEKYRNSKGNSAKCPWSHKGEWFPGLAPGQCGSCGSLTETLRQWVPDDKYKNRVTLIRLIMWWCDDQAEQASDGIVPVLLPGNIPAVELSFQLPLPFRATTGEPYILSGHLDGIDRLGDEYFIADNKTTKKGLTDSYWRQFSPNPQVDFYNLAGSILWPTLKIKGVRIDAAQITVGGAEFGARVFYATPAAQEELLKDLQIHLGHAEQHARSNYWPMNRKSCFMCQFNGVCNTEPEKRDALLQATFARHHWNPLEER